MRCLMFFLVERSRWKALGARREVWRSLRGWPPPARHQDAVEAAGAA